MSFSNIESEHESDEFRNSEISDMNISIWFDTHWHLV